MYFYPYNLYSKQQLWTLMHIYRCTVLYNFFPSPNYSKYNEFSWFTTGYWEYGDNVLIVMKIKCKKGLTSLNWAIFFLRIYLCFVLLQSPNLAFSFYISHLKCSYINKVLKCLKNTKYQTPLLDEACPISLKNTLCFKCNI